MSEVYAALLKRVYLVMRPVEQTWKTLPADDQEAWATFFHNFGINVADMTPVEARKFRGAFAQLWAMAHEYYRFYGPLWGTNEKEAVMTTPVHPHGEHVCYCPYCNYELTVEEGQKCNEQTCPNCGTALRAKEIGERRGR
jgi:hypothetical protein